MRKGLFKNLALAAPLVVCLPLCAQAGDAAASSDEPAAKIFEDYAFTSGTQNNGDSKVVNTNASLDAPAHAHPRLRANSCAASSPGEVNALTRRPW